MSQMASSSDKEIMSSSWNQGQLLPERQMGSTTVTMHDLRVTEKQNKDGFKRFLQEGKDDGIFKMTMNIPSLVNL